MTNHNWFESIELTVHSSVWGMPPDV